MTTIRRSVAMTIRASAADHIAAIRNTPPEGSFGYRGCYVETSVRATMRRLLDGAGDTQSTVKLGFYKKGGELRHMYALPMPEVDGTNQFYTVKDLELSADAKRPVYRRVNLDAIVAAQVEFHMGAL